MKHCETDDASPYIKQRDDSRVTDACTLVFSCFARFGAWRRLLLLLLTIRSNSRMEPSGPADIGLLYGRLSRETFKGIYGV
jgi:hypothetical protein